MIENTKVSDITPIGSYPETSEEERLSPMNNAARRKAQLALVILISLASVTSLATEDHNQEIERSLKSDQFTSYAYHYGWLGVLSAGTLANASLAHAATEYSYREAYTLLSIRSAYGAYKFITTPIESLDGYDRLEAITKNKHLGADQRNKQIRELAQQVAIDQESRTSVKRFLIGTAINALMTARIYQKTQDRAFASQTFITGFVVQSIMLWTVPSSTKDLAAMNRSQWNLSTATPPNSQVYKLSWTYYFH